MRPLAHPPANGKPMVVGARALRSVKFSAISGFRMEFLDALSQIVNRTIFMMTSRWCQEGF